MARILLAGDAPWNASGYGTQMALFAPRFKAAGHEIAIATKFGLGGGMLRWDNDISVLPASSGSWGHRYLRAHATRWQADVVITFADVWNMDPRDIATMPPWCPWVPIDSEPVAPIIAGNLSLAMLPIAMSAWGAAQLLEVGIRAAYVPLAVDTSLFCPGSRSEARDRLGWPKDRWIVGIVAANKDFPSRKALPEQLEAFARFKRKRSDALLYLHSELADGASATGVPLPALLSDLGLEIGRDVITPDRYALEIVGFDRSYMADVMRGIDVLSHVTCGEGFGLGLIEAQACGTPVVCGDWTAMGELCWSGVKIPKAKAQRFRLTLHNWHYIPRVSAIADALDLVYRRAAAPRVPSEVAQYDVDRVMEDVWHPVLARIEQRIGAEPKSPCHGAHRFHTIALHTGNVAAVPCLAPACAAQRVNVNGQWVDTERGFGMVLDGIHYDFEDDPRTGVAKIVLREIDHAYGLREIVFRAGDLVIDIGAHVGVVSIWLARNNPGLRVLAYEPLPANFERLQRNIAANGLGEQISAYPLAVTSDGRSVPITEDPTNSGAASICTSRSEQSAYVASTTLSAILSEVGDRRVRLLKLDCEGAEHEIIAAAQHLERIDYVRGELHSSPLLEATGRTPESFTAMLEGKLGYRVPVGPWAERVKLSLCRIN